MAFFIYICMSMVGNTHNILFSYIEVKEFLLKNLQKKKQHHNHQRQKLQIIYDDITWKNNNNDDTIKKEGVAELMLNPKKNEDEEKKKQKQKKIFKIRVQTNRKTFGLGLLTFQHQYVQKYIYTYIFAQVTQ